MNNLWNLQFGGTRALPILTRGNSQLTDTTTDIKDLTNLGVYGDQSEQLKDPIDVVKNFAWTNSPRDSRDDVPKIQLIEQRIVLNSTVTNLVYSTLASLDGIAAGGNTLLGLKDRFFPSDQESEQGEGDNTEEKKGLQDKIRDIYESTLEQGFFKTFSSDVLKPYEGLYATEYTGFNYYFPYLGDEYRSVTNNFGENAGNVAAPVADFLKGLSEGVAGIANIVKPGTYIERSKQFSMGDSGRSFSFSFPLLNTRNFNGVKQNWQLLFGLIYQNRPGRVSKSIIDQPVIYEVLFPGVLYMPYAYISQLSITFLGNRRVMEFEVPIMNEGVDGGTSNNIGTIKTTIPDAYNVNITLQGMNEETRNFLYASVKKDKLTVNKPIQGFPTPIEAPGLAAGITSEINPSLDIPSSSSTLPPIQQVIGGL